MYGALVGGEYGVRWKMNRQMECEVSNFREQMKLEIEIPEGDYAAVLFDCDGTVADTMLAHYEAWREALGETARFFSIERHVGWAGLPTETIVEEINRRFGARLDAAEFARRKERCYLARLGMVRPVEEVVDYARRQAGRVPLAIVSGGRREVVEKTLEAVGIRWLFTLIVTAEDYREPKPSPEPFLTAASKLDVEPNRCLVFEDSKLGVEAARRAGMDVVYVPTNERIASILLGN